LWQRIFSCRFLVLQLHVVFFVAFIVNSACGISFLRCCCWLLLIPLGPGLVASERALVFLAGCADGWDAWRSMDGRFARKKLFCLIQLLELDYCNADWLVGTAYFGIGRFFHHHRCCCCSHSQIVFAENLCLINIIRCECVFLFFHLIYCDLLLIVR
jgi:hypothetical protein